MVITNNKKPITSTFGNVGDYYINTSTNTTYKCVNKDCESSKYQFIDVNVDCCPDHTKYVWDRCGKNVITNCYNFFFEGVRLDMLNNIDTSKSPVFVNMFGLCESLASVPELDTSNGVYFDAMFGDCSSLTSIPELDTSKGISFSSMFGGCSLLKTIPKLDLSNGTELKRMLNGCSTLESIRLYNIRADIQIGSNMNNYGTLLDVDSLVHTIKELCKVDTTKTLTMSTASRDKIANLYCKVIDDSTEKIEMELCNSTDSGAMTLSAYAALKNWTFKYE